MTEKGTLFRDPKLVQNRLKIENASFGVKAKIINSALLPLMDTSPETPGWLCQYCGRSFKTHHGLQCHVAKLHPIQRSSKVSWDDFSKQRDGTGGLPVCAWCQKDYITWPALKRHLALGSCVGRANHVPHSSSNSPPGANSLAPESLTYSWKELRTTCIICTQWCPPPDGLKPASGKIALGPQAQSTASHEDP